MSNFLIPVASHWAGDAVECEFKASADGAALANYEGTQALFDIPSGTSEVKLTVKPTSPLFWNTEVVLAVSSSGAFSIKNNSAPNSAPFVSLKTVKSNASQGTVVLVKVSRFKNVTTPADVLPGEPSVLGQLGKPPSKRRKKPGKSWVIEDVTATEVPNHVNSYGTWPPHDWDLNPVPDAHFLDVNTPLTSEADVKARTLNFAKDPSLTVDAENIVLRIAGGIVPELFAVTWPQGVERLEDSDPTSFLVYFRQTNKSNGYDEQGQFVGGDVGKDPYPFNFDFADTGLFESLHYAQRPSPPSGTQWKDPFQGPLFWPGAKGVAYQLAKSRAKVVIVTPCNKFGGEEFGILQDTEQTAKILQEIQAFMFWRAGVADPPKSIGRAALAAFSSGNYKLSEMLGGKGAKATPSAQGLKNLQGDFLLKTLKAIYFLDPPDRAVDQCIAMALNWAKKADDPRIRFYSQYNMDSQKGLLGLKSTDNLPPMPYVESALNNTRTATALPQETWNLTFKTLFHQPRDPLYAFGDVHHSMPGTMLLHALSQTDFDFIPVP
jgi:hypothetical protein